MKVGKVNYISLTDLARYNNSARRQMEALKNNKSLKDVELLQKQVNENKLIEQ